MPMGMSDAWQEIRPTTRPLIHDCHPGWSWDVARMPDFDIWCAWRGEGVLEVNQSRFDVRPGDAFLLQPGDQIRGRHDPAHPFLVFAAHFEPVSPLGEAVLDRVREAPVHAMLDHAGFWQEATSRCAAIWDQPGMQPLAGAIFHHLLHQILQGSDSGTEPVPVRRVRQVMRDIQQHPGENWPVEVMARRCGCSRAQLTRYFQKVAGCAPTGFVIHCRVEMACYLLRESNFTISEISDQLGYRDPFFFSRQFKSRVGMAPESYRRFDAG